MKNMHQNLNIYVLHSKDQLDILLKGNPGCAESIDFLFINNSIKDLLKTPEYFNISASIQLTVKYNSIYYYE